MIHYIKNKLLIKKLNSIFAKEAKANKVTYNRSKYYQAYDRINLKGARSVEERLSFYNLSPYINSKSKILDIGSNAGFFVTELSLSCGVCHGVEPNKYLNLAGETVATYLNTREKVEFFDEMFMDFKPTTKYDVIMSLAAFYTSDGRERSSAKEYFSKINNMLNKKGILVYESTGYSRKHKEEENPFGYNSKKMMELAEKEIKALSFEILRKEEVQVGEDAFRALIIARKSK